MRRIWLALAMVAALGADARAGSTEDLATARTRKEQLDFEGALAACKHGLAAGDAEAFSLTQLYQLAGELAAGLDRNDEAFDWFRHLLALQPEARLEDGISPKIAAPFALARDWLRSNGELRVTSTSEKDAFVVVIENDPLRMVTAVRITIVDGNGNATTQQRDETSRIELAWEKGSQTVTVVLLDEHGNRLRELTGFHSDEDSGGGSHRPGLLKRFEVWGVLAVAGLLTGVVEGIRVVGAQHDWDRLRAEDGLHDYSELAALEQHGRRMALTANVGFGVAAVATGLAAYFLVRELRLPSHRHPRMVMLDGGLGVGLAGEF